MKQEKVQKEYIETLTKELPKKITSEFIKKYYSASNQAKLGLKKLNKFEDALLMNGLASLDCIELGLDFSSLSQEEFERLPFDSRTMFSDETKEQFHPEQILERSKKFGLGLSETGLTGKGVHIAIRDRNCDPYLTDANVVEYTKKEDGNTYHEVNPEDVEHMHGLTTTSLLASQSCGVAKGASVHFFSGSITEYVDYIIDYNQKCKENGRLNDMILVASGSWSIKLDEDKKIDFETVRDKLRHEGCELVCANNFNPNFGEFTNNGGEFQSTLDFSEDEINEFKENFPQYKSQIQMLANKNKIRIPISRTYHQVGKENEGEELFKYQSSFSTSWGIPQVAGLLAVFKELDRNLTFDQFLKYAETTATDRNGIKIINPQGIFLEVERIKNAENVKYWHDQKSEYAFERINSGIESRGFSEQEIGKATIHTPMEKKQQAESREQKDIEQIQKEEFVQE